MYFNLFSDRYKLRSTAHGLVNDSLNESTRVGIFYILESSIEDQNILSLWLAICFSLRIRKERRDAFAKSSKNTIIAEIENILVNTEWENVFTICEVVHNYLYGVAGYGNWYESFQLKINNLFSDEQIGFKMIKGKIERVRDAFAEAHNVEARVLLSQSEFAGADAHFGKAIKALNVRPNPDVENCVKDAVSAVESVARVIAKNEKILLSDFVKEGAVKGIIPKPLDEAIQKIYAYRGNEPGVAHGAVSPSKVTIDEAEFVLAMSAAAIIYLVKKRNKFV